jgi:hypothetical protein
MSFLNFIVFAGRKKLAKKFCAKPTYVTIILWANELNQPLVYLELYFIFIIVV